MASVRRINLERTGVRVLVALTVVTLLMVGASALMRVAAQDLYSAVNAARGSGDITRTAYGQWLSAQLSADLPPGDLDAQQGRADELSYRSDRMRELAAVPAVLGLLVAVLTDSPEAGAERRGPDHVSTLGGTHRGA
jgi:hypothetical protein